MGARDFLDEDKYLKFLSKANYNAGKSVQNENAQILKTARIGDFCAYQRNKFEGKNGNKTGCCLNFCTYLLNKFVGLFLTCVDCGALHCAFIYVGKDNNVYVCDPALAKISEQKGENKNYFAIPLHKYRFKNVDKNGNKQKQQYVVRVGLDPDMYTESFFGMLLRGERIVVDDMKDLNEDELYSIMRARNIHSWGAIHVHTPL